MNKDNLSREEIEANIDKLVKALEKSGARELVRLVNKLVSASESKFNYTVPYGLIADPDEHDSVQMTSSPYTVCKFTHLVLSPETAKSYDLEFFQIANIYSTGDANPIPLEPFSIEYMNDDRLAACMEWKSVTIGPANRFSISARLRKGFSRVQFRGVLWAVSPLV